MGYGKNLRDILDEKGMTVKELAKKPALRRLLFTLLFKEILRSDLILPLKFQTSSMSRSTRSARIIRMHRERHFQNSRKIKSE